MVDAGAYAGLTYADSVFGVPCVVGRNQRGTVGAVVSKRQIPGGDQVFLDVAGRDVPDGSWPVLVADKAAAGQLNACVGREGDLVSAQGTFRVLLEAVEGGDVWFDTPHVLTLKGYILGWLPAADGSGPLVPPPEQGQLLDFGWGNGPDYLVEFRANATGETVDHIDWEFGDGAIASQTGPFGATSIPSLEHTYTGPGPWVVTASAVTAGNRTGDISKLVPASAGPAAARVLVDFGTGDQGGGLVTFLATVTGDTDVAQVDWAFGDGTTLTQTGPFPPLLIPEVEHDYGGAGTWIASVSVVVAGVRSGTATHSVGATAVAAVDFAWRDDGGGVVTFRATATDAASVDAVGWDFGDTTTLTQTGPYEALLIPEAEHTYAGPGDYEVSATVTAGGVPSAPTTHTVTVGA